MPNLGSLKVVIRCRDYDTSLDFYTRVLGLEVVDQGMNRAEKAAFSPWLGKATLRSTR